MRHTTKRRIRRIACYAAFTLAIAATAATFSDIGLFALRTAWVPCVIAIFFWILVEMEPRNPGGRSPRATFCSQCGYDLRYSPERCPECGHEETDYERFSRDPTHKP